MGERGGFVYLKEVVYLTRWVTTAVVVETRLGRSTTEERTYKTVVKQFGSFLFYVWDLSRF